MIIKVNEDFYWISEHTGFCLNTYQFIKHAIVFYINIKIRPSGNGLRMRLFQYSYVIGIKLDRFNQLFAQQRADLG